MSYVPNTARTDRANNWSTVQLATAIASIDLGSTTKAWRDIYLSQGTNYTKITPTTLSGNRTVTLPDADSNTVRPLGSQTSNQWVTYVDSSGVQHTAQIAFSNLSGTAALGSQVSGTLPIANGGTNNNALGVSALGIYTADGSKIVQVTGSANQSFRVNAGGTAIEAYTPSAGGSWTKVSVTSTPYTITEASNTFFYVGTAGDTINLPAATGTMKIYKFARAAGATGDKTIVADGIDLIYNAGEGSTLLVFTNGVVELMDLDTNVWMVT